MSFEKMRLKLSKVVGLLMFLFLCFNDSNSEWFGVIEKHQGPSLKAILLFFFGILFVGVGVLGRVWCSLFISGYKNDKLVIYGPYSMCRNPLYFFSFIAVIGVGMTTKTFAIPLGMIVLFAFYYPFVIKSEQKFLLGIYKEEFLEYIKNVPCFFPSFSKYSEPEEYVVRPKRFKRFLTEVVWFIWLVGLIQLIDGLKALNYLPVLFHIKLI